MSFDTDFNYTPMVNKLSDKIKIFEETSEQLGKQIDALAAENKSTAAVASKKATYDNMIEEYNDTIDEIEAVEALSYQNKQVLWKFYAHSCASIYQYMRVIAHSHEQMLADTDIIAMGELLPTTETKTKGAKILSKYTDSACA